MFNILCKKMTGTIDHQDCKFKDYTPFKDQLIFTAIHFNGVVRTATEQNLISVRAQMAYMMEVMNIIRLFNQAPFFLLPQKKKASTKSHQSSAFDPRAYTPATSMQPFFKGT